MLMATHEPRAFQIAPNSSATRRLPSAVFPLISILRELANVIASMTDQQYGLKPVGVVPSSIGGHVRHCLDHIDALLAGVERGDVDYDQRKRGTEVETNRLAALESITRQERQLLAFARFPEKAPLRLSVMLTSSDPPVVVETTLGRELAAALSHTIHHNALIGVMAKLLGIPIPERFGYAPSTIAHLEKTACVR